MNDGTGGSHGRHRRAGRRRAGVLPAAPAAVALLVTACGSGGGGGGGVSAATTGSKTYQKALAYAQCIRSHGEPDWPDPSSDGTFSTSQIDINSSVFSAALSACGQPPAGAQFQLSAAQKQVILNEGLKNAECMRAHGIKNFPDPSLQDVTANGGNVGMSVSLAGTG